jgi:Na+/phosphate symporter
MSQPQIHVVITKSEKNPILGAALSFFFGCLGMLYSTPKGALIMFLPTVISACLIPFLIGIPMIIVCNIVSCVWAYKACETHNNDLQKTVQESHLSKAA